MSHQNATPPTVFYVQDLERVFDVARDIAHKVSAEQRWRLANTIKWFTASVQPFRFMDVPPELRNRIHELCLRSPEPLKLPCMCEHPREELALQPPITRVSRQIRKESLPLFFLLNDFEAHIYRCDFRHFIQYADSIQTSGATRIGLITFKITTCDGGNLHCGNGLEQLVQWYATTEFDIERYEFKDAGLGDHNVSISDAMQLSIDLYNKCAEGGDYSVPTIAQAFQDWLSANGLSCRGAKCEQSQSCSKIVQDRGREDGWDCTDFWIDYCLCLHCDEVELPESP